MKRLAPKIHHFFIVSFSPFTSCWVLTIFAHHPAKSTTWRSPKTVSGGLSNWAAEPQHRVFLKFSDKKGKRNSGHISNLRFANPPASYRSLSGPPGPKFKKVWTPKSQEKVSKKFEKSGKSLENACSRLFRAFFQTFWDTRAGGAGRLFQTFLGFRARRAQETPVARGRVRNLRWAKTRVFKKGHARVETRVLKTLACHKRKSEASWSIGRQRVSAF